MILLVESLLIALVAVYVQAWRLALTLAFWWWAWVLLWEGAVSWRRDEMVVKKHAWEAGKLSWQVVMNESGGETKRWEVKRQGIMEGCMWLAAAHSTNMHHWCS